MQNPSVKHGDIKILFTPDEEVGMGLHKVDMQKLGASFGYTLMAGSEAAWRMKPLAQMPPSSRLMVL